LNQEKVWDARPIQASFELAPMQTGSGRDFSLGGHRLSSLYRIESLGAHG